MARLPGPVKSGSPGFRPAFLPDRLLDRTTNPLAGQDGPG